jgi:hypothetical protein
MRMVPAALAIALAVGLGSGAIGSAALAGDTAATDASKPDKSKKVCKTIVTTGTRFSTRHCRSKEDWDKDAETSRRYLEESQTYGYAREGGMTDSLSGNTPPR